MRPIGFASSRWPKRVEILPASIFVIHSRAHQKTPARECFFEFTMRQSARSNTALFRISRNGDQASLPPFQDAARAASRFPGAQSHAWWTQSTAQPARARPAAHRAGAATDKRLRLV